MAQKQTSFDEDISQNSENYQDYIDNLKSNNQMIAQALKTAEVLIDEYQHENVELKKKNKILEELLDDREEQLEYLKNLVMNQEHQIALQQKVRELMEDNTKLEDRVASLTHQLQRCNKKLMQINKMKQSGIEKNLNNYFKFSKSVHQSYPNMQSTNAHKQIRSLNWKLQQRQEQINMLLRRNKIVEQKLEGAKQKLEKQQLVTCSTQGNKQSPFAKQYKQY